MNRSSLEYNRI